MLHLLVHLLLLPKLLLQLHLPLLGLLLESLFPFFHLHLCYLAAMSLTLQWKAYKEA
jgi:hypothetical protein